MRNKIIHLTSPTYAHYLVK